MRFSLTINKPRAGKRTRCKGNSNKYPFAEFVANEIVEFPATASAGQEVKVQVRGDMTIRGITKPVTFDVTVKQDGDTLVGVGTTQIYMKDFGFDPLISPIRRDVQFPL
ncbi:MAG: YceI family protein [Chloroflexi bacterium]|nr:YceI family protein [Chloroflexota bacterium]